MKSLVFLIFFIIVFSITKGQNIESLFISASQHNEPPVNPPPSKYLLNYNRTKGGLVATLYQVGDVKLRIDLKTITNTELQILNNQIRNKKNKFELNDLDSEIQRAQVNTIFADSFAICRSYERVKVLATGGYQISISIRDKTREVFSFDYDSGDPRNFNLKGYLTLYPTLVDKLPENFPGATMFSKTYLNKVLNEYSETIQCEDFYYQEFIDKNPNRTSQQNRTKEGWNFEQYLKERNNQ